MFTGCFSSSSTPFTPSTGTLPKSANLIPKILEPFSDHLFIQDWDLTLFAPSSVRNNPDHPWGLRRHTHFHTREIYYGAILIDLMLRCTWSLKLSPHLDHFNDLEGSIFIMEFLEVLRRMLNGTV